MLLRFINIKNILYEMISNIKMHDHYINKKYNSQEVDQNTYNNDIYRYGFFHLLFASHGTKHNTIYIQFLFCFFVFIILICILSIFVMLKMFWPFLNHYSNHMIITLIILYIMFSVIIEIQSYNLYHTNKKKYKHYLMMRIFAFLILLGMLLSALYINNYISPSVHMPLDDLSEDEKIASKVF